MSALGEYLGVVGRQQWNYGDKASPKRDCCTFVADWCVACGYPDPMAFIRDNYTTEAEALELVRKTGLLRFAVRGARSIGLRATTSPRCGDVAVLRRLTVEGDNVVCAIRSGERWVTLLEQGLVVDAGGELLKAWRVKWARQ